MHAISTKKAFLLLIFPAILLFLVYVIFPIGVAFFYSITNYQGLGDYRIIGLQNYVTLFHNKYFFWALKNVGIIMVFNTLFSIPFAFMLAMLVNKKIPGSETFKVILFVPGVISGIMVGLIWTFMFDPSIGLLNSVFHTIGLDFLELKWIGGKTLTPLSVSIVATWHGLGFNILLLLAGLKMIPGEIFEAATIDGASRHQSMVYITIPMLKESFKVCFVLLITNTLKVFETVYMLTGGGPNHYSETLLSLMYNETFISYKYGYGMSMAVIEFLIALILSMTFLKVTDKRIED